MSITIEAVEASLREFVTKDILLRKELVDRDEDLFAAGFDSLSLSRLLVFAEERFGVHVPNDEVDIDAIATVATMAPFFHAYLGKTPR